MKIDGKSNVVGLMGWPVEHSFSPRMHNAAFAAVGLNWVYVPFAVPADRVETAVSALPALSLKGVNVTVPHKQAVIPYLHQIEEGARRIGAVNTIVVGEDGSLAGYNTDWSGFLADLDALRVPFAGRDCLILGAGGAARSVAYGLAQGGGRVQVLARRAKQTESLIAALEIPSIRGGELSDLPAILDALHEPLIINSTPVGMSPRTEQSVWPEGVPFPAGSFVYDLVYNPRQTMLMRQAEASGCRAANGLGMLVQQGAEAFKLWTGVEPELSVMWAVVE